VPEVARACRVWGRAGRPWRSCRHRGIRAVPRPRAVRRLQLLPQASDHRLQPGDLLRLRRDHLRLLLDQRITRIRGRLSRQRVFTGMRIRPSYLRRNIDLSTLGRSWPLYSCTSKPISEIMPITRFCASADRSTWRNEIAHNGGYRREPSSRGEHVMYQDPDPLPATDRRLFAISDRPEIQRNKIAD
jgi:hypothetical protein